MIALLLGVDRTTITRAIGAGKHLLEQHGTTIEPAARLHTLADLSVYAAAHGITQDAETETAC